MDIEKKKLLHLLDFTQVKNLSKVRDQAHLIAQELLSNWSIAGLGGTARIMAIEFYLHIPGVFEDNASHNRLEQLSHAKFYFHTKSKGEKWSPPIFNRHGLDITCGNGERGIYAGILLRHLAIGPLHRDGSGLALRALMRGEAGFEKIVAGSPEFGWKAAELEVMRKLNHQSIFGHEIHLEYSPREKPLIISALPRIGIAKTRYASELLRFKVVI